MKLLYIIGNGFDLAHKLQTKYQHFALYLQEHNNELYELMLKYYWLTDLDPDDENSQWDPLWGDFENKLAEMDFEELLRDFTNYLPDYASNDFRSRDYHTYAQEVGTMINRLTNELYQDFKKFILSVDFPSAPTDLLKLEPNAQYLNFNYTDTLENYYGVKRNRITYIHGRAKTESDRTVLGHGIDPKEFEDKPTIPPSGLSDEELQQWTDEQSDQYDWAYNQGRNEAIAYFDTSHKSTSEIINENVPFFSSLKDIEQIIVLGHSISLVDQPYFLKVIASVDKSLEPKWLVSYYGDGEISERLEKLKDLGVPESKIEFLKIDDLRQRPSTLF